MTTGLIWLIVGPIAVAVVIAMLALASSDSSAPPVRPVLPIDPEPAAGPSDEPTVLEPDGEPAHEGPHTIILRGQVDEGAFVLVRTPLWDYPFNRSLYTQVFADGSGAMTRARYCVVNAVESGLLELGMSNMSPVSITIGIGTDTVRFPDTPDTTWTH